MPNERGSYVLRALLVRVDCVLLVVGLSPPEVRAFDAPKALERTLDLIPDGVVVTSPKRPYNGSPGLLRALPKISLRAREPEAGAVEELGRAPGEGVPAGRTAQAHARPPQITAGHAAVVDLLKRRMRGVGAVSVSRGGEGERERTAA